MAAGAGCQCRQRAIVIVNRKKIKKIRGDPPDCFAQGPLPTLFQPLLLIFTLWSLSMAVGRETKFRTI